MLLMPRDISCFPSRDRSDAGRAMLDAGQSLQINLYKHIELKIVVNFLNPFYSGFDPGLYCDRAYTSINTSLWHALHFFLLKTYPSVRVTNATLKIKNSFSWFHLVKSVNIIWNKWMYLFFSKIIIVIICFSLYINYAFNIAWSIIILCSYCFYRRSSKTW